jgi:segregation and condensation protein B
VAEAARRLGLDRSRVYALTRSGDLQATTDPLAGLQIDVASVERRLLHGDVAGSPLSAANAWFLIALASGDPLFEAHVSGLARPAMLRRVRARLAQDGLLAVAPRLRRRAVLRQMTVSSARAAELAADRALVRTGPSAAAAYGWSDIADLPLDAYVPPPLVPELLATPDLDASEPRATVWLRVPSGAWPFPPQRTVAPAALAALDLLDHPAAAAQQQARSVLAGLHELRAATLLRRDARGRWRGVLALAKPESSAASTLLPPRPPVADLFEDDATVAAHMLAVLHASASAGASRAELGAALDVPAERIEAGWAYLRLRAPAGLRVQRDAEHFGLVTDGACAASVERFLKRAERPQPLSQAQREVLAIVAYAQPVSRARVDEIRGASSDAAVSFVLQRGLIGEHRPRSDAPALLVTTAECLAYLGLTSLDELPSLQAVRDADAADGEP